MRGLAAAVGVPLLEVPLTSDTDTSDLLGSFEQLEPMRKLQQVRGQGGTRAGATGGEHSLHSEPYMGSAPYGRPALLQQGCALSRATDECHGLETLVRSCSAFCALCCARCCAVLCVVCARCQACCVCAVQSFHQGAIRVLGRRAARGVVHALRQVLELLQVPTCFARHLFTHVP